jgi:hypothetical protein
MAMGRERGGGVCGDGFSASTMSLMSREGRKGRAVLFMA